MQMLTRQMNALAAALALSTLSFSQSVSLSAGGTNKINQVAPQTVGVAATSTAQSTSVYLNAYRGSWNASVLYGRGDVVVLQGSSYVSLIANVGKSPATNPIAWAVFAAQGSALVGAFHLGMAIAAAACLAGSVAAFALVEN